MQNPLQVIVAIIILISVLISLSHLILKYTHKKKIEKLMRRRLNLKIDDDKLQLTGISLEEQKRLIHAWLTRHKEPEEEEFEKEEFEKEKFEIEREPEPKPEPPPRYVDTTFYKEKERIPVKSGHTLSAQKWYQLEVAIRKKPTGITVEGERPPLTELKQKEDITLFVTVKSDGFEIENPVSTLVLPPRGDSKENAYFRVRPEKETASLKELATLYVRVYYEFNLLEVAKIQAEVVGEFEDDTYSQFELKEPITCRIERHERDYDIDVENTIPRKMHIDITREDNEYVFTFAFWNDVERKVEFPDVPSKLTTSVLEDVLVTLRKKLWEIVMFETYGKELEGDEIVFSKYMKELASLGRDLWVTLFKIHGGPAMSHVGTWLEDHPLERGSIIQISVEEGADTFVFPWSLLYFKEYPDNMDELPDLDGFWGLRYVIEQRLPVRKYHLISRKWSTEDISIELENGIEIAFMLWPFKQASEQKNLINSLATRFHGQIATGSPIIKPETAYNLLADCTSHIIYFYTHGYTRYREVDICRFDFRTWYETLPSGSPFREDKELKRTYERLKEHEAGNIKSSYIGLRYGKLYLIKLYDKKINLHNHPIVFLNMCESAQVIPSLSESFIDFFIKRGARCVIGTECSMRPVFAHYFSKEFFEALANGESVGQALLSARQKFIKLKNPLGLAYTLFGSATAKFTWRGNSKS